MKIDSSIYIQAIAMAQDRGCELPWEERMDRALLTLHNDWEAYHLDPRSETEKHHNQPSLRAIARRHGVTHTTLMRRYDGVTSKKDAHSSRQRLSPSEEASFVQWILQLASWGWPARISRVKQMAIEILQAKGDHQPLGINWVAKFLSRHNELKTRFS